MIGSGIHFGGKRKTWPGGFSDVEIIQANGIMMITAPTARIAVARLRLKDTRNAWLIDVRR
jgi:hypothetical protein